MCDFLVAWITYCSVRDPPMTGSLFLTNCECSHLKLGSTIRFPNISCIFFPQTLFFLILIFLNDVLENSGRVYLLLRV